MLKMKERTLRGAQVSGGALKRPEMGQEKTWLMSDETKGGTPDSNATLRTVLLFGQERN